MASPAKKSKMVAAPASASASTSKSNKKLTDITTLYGVNFQPEILGFWKSCLKKSPINPLKSVPGWVLVGPFQVLNGDVNFENRLDALLYQRCYHDSPEFLTFAYFSSKEKNIRLAFYRVSPKAKPVIVKIERFIEKQKEGGGSSGSDEKPKWSKILPTYSHVGDGSEVAAAFEKAKVAKKQTNNRPKKISGLTTICDTLTNLGIFVPMQNDIGYRDLQITDKKLKRTLTNIHNAELDSKRKEFFKPLLQINNNIQYANDECDFGMCYEFGFDLFHFGSFYLNKFCLKTLPLAYSLLGWDEFALVLQAHMKERKDETEEKGFFTR